MALGLAAVGCSHEIGGGEADLRAQIIAEYNEMFIKTFGRPAADQDWGFGTSGTRSLFGEYWNGIHNATASSKVPCGVNWTDTISYEIPSGTETVTADTKFISGTDYYVPSTFNGKVKFADNYNGNIYVAGKVTGYEGGNQQKVNIYIFEDASWTGGVTSGEIKFYNNGDLILGGSDLQNSNIKYIYNAGSFKYTGSNTNTETYFYSTGTVELTADNVDFKLKSDIHNTMTVKGNIKIQNSTPKYICGIDAAGHNVHNVDGPLVTSNVIADNFSFDGNPIYLTQGGHIDVTTTFTVPNNLCHVYAVEGSTALVEAKNFEFGNKNDFTHTFSNNIYFKVKDGYIKIAGCYDGGVSHDFANVSEYINFDNMHNGNKKNDEYDLAKDRINAGNATGSPACGKAWTVGTPTGGGEPEFLGRVFAEDLTVSEATDFDFTDVVFDVYYDSEKGTYVELLAAGGTLPLYINGDSNHGAEVHAAFGVPTTTMVNTGLATAPVKTIIISSTSKVQPGDIDIYVTKDGVDVKLEAPTGKAASKFCDKKLQWARERQDVDEVMNFTEYVREKAELLNKNK